MEFSLETMTAVEQAFLAAERAVGPLSAAVFEYEEWGDEIHCGDVSVTRRGSNDGLVSIQDYATRSSEELFGKLDTILDEVFELGLQETPSRDETDSSSGEIHVNRVGNTQLSVEWEHTDKFTFSEDDEMAAIGYETWEQFYQLVTELGADALFIEYNGGGDSMDGASYRFTDKEGNEVQVDQNGEICKKIDKVFDSLMEGPVSGFWENEGGHGEIMVKESEEDSYWSHWNYVSGTETFTGTFVLMAVTPQQISENDLIEAVADPVWG